MGEKMQVDELENADYPSFRQWLRSKVIERCHSIRGWFTSLGRVVVVAFDVIVVLSGLLHLGISMALCPAYGDYYTGTWWDPQLTWKYDAIIICVGLVLLTYRRLRSNYRDHVEGIAWQVREEKRLRDTFGSGSVMRASQMRQLARRRKKSNSP